MTIHVIWIMVSSLIIIIQMVDGFSTPQLAALLSLIGSTVGILEAILGVIMLEARTIVILETVITAGTIDVAVTDVDVGMAEVMIEVVAEAMVVDVDIN